MKHYLAAILGFVIWGTFSLVLKPLSDFAALDILLFRVIFASILIGCACLLWRRKQLLYTLRYIRKLSGKTRRMLAVNLVTSALLLAINWYLFIYVMNQVSVSATALAYLICPIITTVLASLFLKERLYQLQRVAVAMCVLSCLIMGYGHFLDILFSSVIALTYAMYLILQKNKFPMDRMLMLATHIIIATLCLLPLLSVSDFSRPKPVMFFGYIGLIALVYTIIPLLLNVFALRKLDSSVVGILLYLNPLIGFGLGIFYYNEPVTTVQLIAFTLIFIAVVLFNVSYFNGKKKDRILRVE